MGKPGKERMKELRQRRKDDASFDIEGHKEKERKRIASLRKKQKAQRSQDPELMSMYREKEKLRKREQRLKTKNRRDQNLNRSEVNKRLGIKRRRKHQETKNGEIKKLELKVKMFENLNRRLKRRLNKTNEVSSSQESFSDAITASSVVLDCVSPSAKKRAIRRIKLSNTSTPIVKNSLRLDRVNVKQNGRPSNLKNKIITFLHADENSMEVPDVKKHKKGLRYRLLSLKELHLKFLADVEESECSYAQFCRCVPKEIIKPKPEDWGTCLCMTCLNPELKFEAIKRTLGDTHNLNFESLKDPRFKDDIRDLCHQIESSDTAFEYLEWSKEKGHDVRASSYFSKKNACSSSGKEFSKKFQDDIESLVNHATRFKSQYQRIAEVKQIAQDQSKTSKLLRIDWSENVDLYQTRQEKSQYYTSISASINTAVLYSHDGVKSLCTISDEKSHTAPATWASLSSIFQQINLGDTQTLYIASDSPTSQYRNKKNVFLTKQWAMESKIEVCWIFTETGHGKGPMDGVGGAMKTKIKDTIAYRPNSVIRNTAQLINHLPEGDIIVGTYNKADYEKFALMIPKPLDNLTIKSTFGISKVHEILFSVTNDLKIQWKMLSTDLEYSGAEIKIRGIQGIR